MTEYWLSLEVRFVGSLLYGTMQDQKYTWLKNSPYGKIQTKKELIRMLRFTSGLPSHKINNCISPTLTASLSQIHWELLFSTHNLHCTDNL